MSDLHKVFIFSNIQLLHIFREYLPSNTSNMLCWCKICTENIHFLICVTCIHFIRLFCSTHAFYSALGAQVFCRCIFSIIINTGKVQKKIYLATSNAQSAKLIFRIISNILQGPPMTSNHLWKASLCLHSVGPWSYKIRKYLDIKTFHI